MEAPKKTKNSLNTDDLLWPSLDHRPNYTVNTSGEEKASSELLWPSELINEQAEARTESHWPLTLSTFSFVMASILAFLIGPMQMILLMITKNYEWVTTDYYPTVLKVMLLSSGLLSLVNVSALVLAWKSRPRTARLTAVLVAGAAHLFSIGWVAAFLITFQPNQLAITTLMGIFIFWTGALLISKQYSSRQKPSLIMHLILVGLILSATAEAIFTGIYIFQKTNLVEIDETAIEELVDAEFAARIEGIPEDLGKRAFAICSGAYHLVFQSPTDPETALFECKDTAEVYSISTSKQDAQAPSAAYLGKVKDASVETAFPDAKYLYRDLSAKELPSELTILLPASSETELVEKYLEPIRQVLENHGALKLNIFWTNELENILSTRDFVLIGAVGTMSMVDWLPHGTIFQGIEAGQPIKYSFEIDHHLIALRDLGADPKLYPTATRDALKTKPHLSYVQTERPENLNLDELRDTLLNSFVQPE